MPGYSKYSTSSFRIVKFNECQKNNAQNLMSDREMGMPAGCESNHFLDPAYKPETFGSFSQPFTYLPHHIAGSAFLSTMQGEKRK
jgi:hypothetical protein